MAHSLSAQKRIRQNLKRRLRNKRIKSSVKSRVKKVRTLVSAYSSSKENKEGQTGLSNIQSELSNAYKALDKAVSSGVIHRNKAARLKSRLTLALNKTSSK